MENDRTIEIVVDVKAEDYRRILWWYHWKRIALFVILWLFIFPTIIWFVSFGAGARSFTTGNNLTVIIFLIFTLVPIMTGLSIYFSIWKQAKKIEKISERTRFVFSDLGLDSQNSLASTKMGWGRLSKIHETKTDFIFFPQENIFYTVPKRFFASNEQIESFKTLVREKLGNKAKLKD